MNSGLNFISGWAKQATTVTLGSVECTVWYAMSANFPVAFAQHLFLDITGQAP